MNIKVNLAEIAPTGGFNATVLLRAVPRVGDSISIGAGKDERVLRVHSVIWTPMNHPYEVQVRFR